jgi:hypothetical protein
MTLRPHGQVLLATLGCLALTAVPHGRPLPPELDILHRWLDTWDGIGLIERGMAREDFDLSLTRYADEGWRATFYTKGREHSATSAIGDAWARTPWTAVQRAAWKALNKADLAAA